MADGNQCTNKVNTGILSFKLPLQPGVAHTWHHHKVFCLQDLKVAVGKVLRVINQLFYVVHPGD